MVVKKLMIQVRTTQFVSVRIGYEYGLVYYASRADFGASFYRFSSANLNVRVSRSTQSGLFWVNREVQLNGNTLSDMGLGGWTLAIQHTYDAVNGNLSLLVFKYICITWHKPVHSFIFPTTTTIENN